MLNVESLSTSHMHHMQRRCKFTVSIWAVYVCILHICHMQWMCKFTVSIWAVRIEEDKKLLRPLWSGQLEEPGLEQTVAGA